MTNIDQYIDDLIKREGGYVSNPADRGGPTKYGIALTTARRSGYTGNMQDLPIALAKHIYTQQYWIEPRFDRINAVSPAVAEELLDTGVNCGTGFAKPLLQRALNLLNNNGNLYPDLEQDGVYGDKTIAALTSYLKLRGKPGEVVLLRVLNTLQGQRYIDICEKNPSQKQFVYGWFANRVSI